MGANKARMDEILRVDHAGEYAAVLIYRAQKAVFEGRKAHGDMARDLGEMQDQEAVHLARFERLLNARRVRPTLMTPVWRIAASALGAGTALMGEKAAHACTEAVESVIEKHYADQIAEIGDRDPALAAELKQFRDEELAHHDHAIEHGSREAPAYRLLSGVIKAGCRVAIKVSEKV
jgi:ubiquinone biosynthesis monooxygenase Coq7